MLENFACVLFRPRSAGNVGAAARALKNMGLRDLRIVAPRYPDGCKASQMAVHGRDVLASAAIYPELAAALEDRHLVFGTTARTGLYRSELRPIREVAPEMVAASVANHIALVFGPEDCGLTNRELKLCQRLITIPTAPQYPSLNLAQAVMIVAYELLLAAGAGRELGAAIEWAPLPAVDAMLSRMARALVALGFIPEDNPEHIMFAFRAIFGRAGLRPRDVDILNGLAGQILWFAGGGAATLAAKRREGKKLR